MATLQTEPGKQPAPDVDRSGRAAIHPFRPHVVGAVFKRNLQSYFSNPAGYVFITLFVLISSAVAFWRDEFFTNNLANLDQLNRYMPYLLLFFIPAITMSLWADERRQGTDELLFTLPAHDLDVVLGKYLAALGIYTVALLFSMSHLLVLWYLGRPDMGVMFSTYLGYWLMGALLIAVGMVASLLSSNVTVAFILGALFCAVPIFIGYLGSPTGGDLRRQLEGWSVPQQFSPFGEGVIPLSGLFYFVSLTAAMLYLNMLLLGRRHWTGGEAGRGRAGHAAIRFLCLLLALFSANVLVGRLIGGRVDASSEGLNTLSPETIELIRKIPADRPVLIQAFYSPEVPRDYVETKNDLLRYLNEIQARSGGRIQLNLIPTETFSTAARDAEKQFGIEPKRVFSADQAKQSSSEIFLGVAFTSGLEEVVIPFFDRGLPVEYELTRSIQVASRSARKKVGILSTDAKLMGGFDQRSFGQSPEWSIVTELKKQYEVSSVSPDAPIATDLGVLLVAQPSSLTQPQIDNLTAFVKAGGATLLLMDPFPVDNPQIAPEVPRQPAGGPFGGGQPPEPKGDLKELLELINVEWPTTEIVWNSYNPHPQLADMPPEVVFIGKGSGAKDAFNPDQAASAGLQEIVALFPGLLRSRNGGGSPEFTPLLRTSPKGGVVEWSEAVQQGFMGVSGINPRRRHFATNTAYTLAARVKGDAAPSKKAEPAEKKDEAAKEAKPGTINVIAIADLDMVSEQFFEIRRRKIENLDFDNVTFVLNCVDVLAGDESFIALRGKRPEHRTLTTIEAQTSNFLEDLNAQTKVAEDAAKTELEGAQKAFDKQVEQVKARTDLDERTKEIMLANLQDVAQRRLDVEKQKIEDEKLNKIREGRAESERKTRAIENRVRYLAAFVPPLPPMILGLLVLLGRLRRENLGASPKRMA
ncbi:Gldg family protein [Paludisphaera rhizosphaerae]|uniref:Gldg family protein n=1 Tax=Paludisphaera rhizosphaerae TaxID=2711216 RepID=UPI001F0DA1F7|nr:Gldg family protein [Paludisphaera rhizosphaerae]